MYRRITTRTLAALGIGRRIQTAIRNGTALPALIGDRIITYCSAGYFATVAYSDWVGAGGSFASYGIGAPRRSIASYTPDYCNGIWIGCYFRAAASGLRSQVTLATVTTRRSITYINHRLSA